MTNHPITPPLELVQQWYDNMGPDPGPFESFAIAAARWGADQELEACCKWLPKLPPWSADDLRRHRRPKPPSLKEQALELVNRSKSAMSVLTLSEVKTIRQALETLPND